MARIKDRSRKMFKHMRRKQYDRALYHAVDGDPNMMLHYYEQRDRGSTGSNYQAPAPVEPAQRSVQINGQTPTVNAWQIIQQLEQMSGSALPDGSYWYDPVCGAFGVWGNPTWFFLPPNLPLGGALDPNCSGPPTGVFINGRDLHPQDLQILNAYIGYVQPGYYYFDAHGNIGVPGYPPSANLRMLMGR